MTGLNQILSLAFDRTDGGLLAPDPSHSAIRRRRIPPKLCFLETFDMDLDGEDGQSEPTQGFHEGTTGDTGAIQPQLDVADTEGTKGGLPGRSRNSIRVYVAHGASGDTQYHEQLGSNVFGDQNDRFRPSMGGYEGLSNQWEKIPNSWFEVPSFAFGEPSQTSKWRRLWRFKQFIASFRKITKEVCILEHEDSKLTLVISIKTYNTFSTASDSNEWLLDTVHDFVGKLSGLGETYRSLLMKREGSRDRKIITMLWFAHAQLVHMLDILKQARRSYQGLRRDALEARNARLLPSVVDDIITDAYLHRELQNRAVDFAFMLESLLDTAGDAIKDKDFGTTFAHVRGLLSDLRRLADDIPRSLEHHLKLLEIRRNVQDSSNQWILTALASIFLPLSLACSLLSMQTRFKDLHYLLYDFCGVVVILLTLVALILLGLKVTMWLIEKVEDGSRKVTSKPGRMMLKRIPRFLMIGTFLYFLPVFLASFIVGMVRDVRLGGLILGYGLAGLVGVSVVFSLLTALVAIARL